MLHRFLLVVLLFIATVVVASPAQAQQSARANVAGPRVALTATAIHVPASSLDRDAALAAARRQSMGQPVALMIVGGAAIVLGAVIAGDAGTLFMIGGAVTGLIGLYQYLQ